MELSSGVLASPVIDCERLTRVEPGASRIVISDLYGSLGPQSKLLPHVADNSGMRLTLIGIPSMNNGAFHSNVNISSIRVSL
jgi:hypothetical protein